MHSKIVKRRELLALLDMDEELLGLLEREEIIHVCSEDGYSDEDADAARLAKTLMRDLEVNLPGVEVILHMRKNMIEMQQQFKQILKELSQRIYP